jgi:hypothetical protein
MLGAAIPVAHAVEVASPTTDQSSLKMPRGKDWSMFLFFFWVNTYQGSTYDWKYFSTITTIMQILVQAQAT